MKLHRGMAARIATRAPKLAVGFAAVLALGLSSCSGARNVKAGVLDRQAVHGRG